MAQDGASVGPDWVGPEGVGVEAHFFEGWGDEAWEFLEDYGVGAQAEVAGIRVVEAGVFGSEVEVGFEGVVEEFVGFGVAVFEFGAVGDGVVGEDVAAGEAGIVFEEGEEGGVVVFPGGGGVGEGF